MIFLSHFKADLSSIFGGSASTHFKKSINPKKPETGLREKCKTSIFSSLSNSSFRLSIDRIDFLLYLLPNFSTPTILLIAGRITPKFDGKDFNRERFNRINCFLQSAGPREHRSSIGSWCPSKVERDHEFLKEFARDKVIYGVNTGFGPWLSLSYLPIRVRASV
ncbi:MAG: hypothetical protein R2769_09875 [Saprospiraceae bacterium]